MIDKFIIGGLVAITLSLPGSQTLAQSDTKTEASGPSVMATKECDYSLSTFNLPIQKTFLDLNTIHANGGRSITKKPSFLSQTGLSFSLTHYKDFTSQANDYAKCKSPFFRGTLGQIMLLNRKIKDNRYEPVPILLLGETDETMAVVAKPYIRDITSKNPRRIAFLKNGRGIDLLARVLRKYNLQPGQVPLVPIDDERFRQEGGTKLVVDLFLNDKVDIVIVPRVEAARLTSGGTIGQGGEGSYKGAYIIDMSDLEGTKEIFAVRRDMLINAPAIVEQFIRGMLLSSEEFVPLMKDDKEKSRRLLKTGSTLYYKTAEAADFLNGSLHETAPSTAAENASYLISKIQKNTVLVDQKLLTPVIQYLTRGKVTATSWLETSGIDIPSLVASRGGALRPDQYITETIVKLASHQKSLPQMPSQKPPGQVFTKTFYFQPNQPSLSMMDHYEDIDLILEKMSGYGGGVVTIEGHSDPSSYLKARQSREPAFYLAQTRMAAKNLSLRRAVNVRDAIIDRAAQTAIHVSPAQFITIGAGIDYPNTSACVRTEKGDLAYNCAPSNAKEWGKTRRVIVRILALKSEEDSFQVIAK